MNAAAEQPEGEPEIGNAEQRVRDHITHMEHLADEARFTVREKEAERARAVRAVAQQDTEQRREALRRATDELDVAKAKAELAETDLRQAREHFSTDTVREQLSELDNVEQQLASGEVDRRREALLDRVRTAGQEIVQCRSELRDLTLEREQLITKREELEQEVGLTALITVRTVPGTSSPETDVARAFSTAIREAGASPYEVATWLRPSDIPEQRDLHVVGKMPDPDDAIDGVIVHDE